MPLVPADTSGERVGKDAAIQRGWLDAALQRLSTQSAWNESALCTALGGCFYKRPITPRRCHISSRHLEY
jgi:hypothetical protein